MKTVRIILWIVVALAAAGFGYLLLQDRDGGRIETSSSRMVDFGGDFTLTGADGRPFSSAQLDGKPYAIFFGFTHCPDVCPTTLARMVRLRQQLNQGERPFEILFVTVDPERDGPAEVGKYAELFDSPVTGLTGSMADIEAVKKKFGIFSQKSPDRSGDSYSVDHTATVLLFGEDGEFVATIAPEEPDSTALDKLRRITA